MECPLPGALWTYSAVGAASPALRRLYALSLQAVLQNFARVVPSKAAPHTSQMRRSHLRWAASCRAASDVSVITPPSR